MPSEMTPGEAATIFICGIVIFFLIFCFIDQVHKLIYDLTETKVRRK